MVNSLGNCTDISFNMNFILIVAFFVFSRYYLLTTIFHKKESCNVRTYSACWKRDQIAAWEFLPKNIPLQYHSLLYQHQEHRGEVASVEQNCADDRSLKQFIIVFIT